MFDIKDFLAENTITLNEGPKDPRIQKYEDLSKQLQSTKEQVRKASERYLQFPDKVAINVMRLAMKQYEKVAAELLKGV